ncbi:toxin [Thiomicrospira aerophila AL3]|uniref:Toxin n=1 Tax=Thiomicrospira aerophila AL3 TaxID=717772 RepID=W0DV94_9GAMM|nr:BrnT family toxin [Thiomicrospira aerophila]AHF01173.1 toxin [Thiomicrospira aerophila AL3]
MFEWNEEKNKLLKKERGIGFEDIVMAIDDGGILDVLDHPDQSRYPGQKIYVVSALGYVYMVPYVRSEQAIFLKTIIPSRKAKKQYLGDSNV